MAKSYVTYPGDGVTTTYTVTFPYLAKSHVHVFLGEEETFSFVWVTDSSIKLDVPSADLVTIRRLTPTDPLVDFTDGSVLTETQLDVANLQSLYVCEETIDAAENSLGIGVPGGGEGESPNDGENWNALNKRIINLASGKDPQDAVNKAQMDAIIPDIQEEVKKATDAAESAASSEQSAAASASSALNSANQAANSATSAKNSADAAAQSATDANNAISSAQYWAIKSEESAITSEHAAENSYVYMQQSKSSASQAASSANEAKNSETNAANSASSALTSKNQAATYADRAHGSANAAAEHARNARTSEVNSKDSELHIEEMIANFNPALMFKGTINVANPAPTTPDNGDTWLVEQTAIAHSSWGSLAGKEINQDSMVVYGDDFDWHNTGGFAEAPGNGITVDDINNWNESYSWGNHAEVGYVTEELDPTVPSHVKAITTTDIAKWNNPPSGLPDQSGKKDLYLRTDGVAAYWDTVAGGGSGGAYLVANEAIYLNRQVITDDYSMPEGFNGMSAGPLSMQGEVFVPSGSEWTIVGSGGSGVSTEVDQRLNYLEDKVYRMEMLLRTAQEQLQNKGN